MKRSSLALLLLFFSMASLARAQDPDFIVPSRPTVSNPAEFQKPGVFQIEFGDNANFRAPGVNAAQDTPLALRFAASRRVLLEVDTDSPSSQNIQGVGSVTGFGDMQLSIQAVGLRETD